MDSTDVMSFIELLKQPKQQPKQQPQPPPLATQQQTTSKSAVPKVTTQSTGYQSLPLPSVPSAPLTKSQVPVTQADISTDVGVYNPSKRVPSNTAQDLAHLNKVAGQIANFTDEYVKCYGSDVVIATLVGSKLTSIDISTITDIRLRPPTHFQGSRNCYDGQRTRGRRTPPCQNFCGSNYGAQQPYGHRST